MTCVAGAVDQPVEGDYESGELLFRFDKDESRIPDGMSDESYFEDRLASLGIDSITPVIVEDDEDGVLYRAQINGDVAKTCRILDGVYGVEYAEPNYICYTDTVELPGEITTSENLYHNHMKWYFEDIMHIPQAWQTYDTVGAGVTVAVIDNGFDLTSLDFPVNLWSDADGNHGWNTADDTNDISPIMKSDNSGYIADASHGSNVAGIIGMEANDTNGIGAAYGADIMLLKAAHYVSDTAKSGFRIDSLVAALQYAVNNGADIVNMSLGSTVYSKALREQVQKTYNAGVAIFASAGNGIYNEDAGMNYGMPTTTNPSYPGADSNCIGVMAIDKTDPTQLSVFSNYDNLGGFYDVAAPGVAIVGCVAGSGIGAMSGTSQATPLVAACAALYLSIYPTVTNAQLYAAVRNSPTRTVTSNQTVDPGCTATFKILDAVELLEYGAVKPEINVNYSTSCTLDNNRGYIYGLDERYTDITNYVTVTPGTGTMLLVRTAIGYGTGSVLNIYKKSGELYRSYQVIIFGDLNGDTIADGCDAVVLSCILDDPTAYEDNIKFAADVSFDDVVTELDREYIFNYAIGLESIFQSR